MSESSVFRKAVSRRTYGSYQVRSMNSQRTCEIGCSFYRHFAVVGEPSQGAQREIYGALSRVPSLRLLMVT